MKVGEVLLRADALGKSFGGLRAVHEVSLQVRAGDVLGLIGPNGAGKSTVVNLLAGVTPVDTGTVSLLGEDITGAAPHERARKGLVRTFQKNQIFPLLNGTEVMMVGLSSSAADSFASWLVRPWQARRRRAELAEEATRQLRAVRLDEALGATPVGLLAPAVNRMLGFAVAMAGAPKVLVLDEPCAGLASSARLVVSERIREIARSGVGVLVIEHDVGFIMSTCDRVIAMDHGVVIAEGEPADVRAHPAVRQAYLGDIDAAS